MLLQRVLIVDGSMRPPKDLRSGQTTLRGVRLRYSSPSRLISWYSASVNAVRFAFDRPAITTIVGPSRPGTSRSRTQNKRYSRWSGPRSRFVEAAHLTVHSFPHATSGELGRRRCSDCVDDGDQIGSDRVRAPVKKLLGRTRLAWVIVNRSLEDLDVPRQVTHALVRARRDCPQILLLRVCWKGLLRSPPHGHIHIERPEEVHDGAHSRVCGR